MLPFELLWKKALTIVEVGAHAGDDRLIRACRKSGHRLYMFEPNPNRAQEARRKVLGAENILVFPVAVSNYNGKATFNIACYDDCSSLQEFDDKANAAWVDDRHPYKRYEMVDHVAVEVKRLDTFMAEQGIATIDVLEIDAQGEDLRVVESLGTRLADVRKVQIEVNIHSAPLYKNAFTMDEAVEFFRGHSFERHVSWRQSLNREANVIFRNSRFYPHPALSTVASFAEITYLKAVSAFRSIRRVLGAVRRALRRMIPHWTPKHRRPGP